MNDKPKLKKIETFPSGINFLVLEDMDNLRMQMVNDLKMIGVGGKIFEAVSVQSAIKICTTEDIGFVMCDWNLPDGNGLDFLKKFRAVARFKTTPFVMCTSNNEISFFLEAVASGANDYIVKPWKPDELKKKIQTTWELIQSRK